MEINNARINTHAGVLAGALILKKNPEYLEERLTHLEMKDDFLVEEKIIVLSKAYDAFKKRFEENYQASRVIISSNGLDSRDVILDYDQKIEEAKIFLDSMGKIIEMLSKLGYKGKNQEFMRLNQEFTNNSFYKE